MTHTAIIKFAPIFTVERFDNPAWNRPGRKMYDPGALAFLPGKETIPVWADHEDREIGTVHKFFRMEWTDGPWVAAWTTITDPPSWLKRGTRASFGYGVARRRELNIRGTRADIIARAVVKEVSVLPPWTPPGEPCAEVWSYCPAEVPSSPAAVRATSDRAAVGEVIADEYRPSMWDELERAVGYRITDANFEGALTQAQRPTIGRLYDEHMASKRNEPQVIVRHGIGQVLGVR